MPRPLTTLIAGLVAVTAFLTPASQAQAINLAPQAPIPAKNIDLQGIPQKEAPTQLAWTYLGENNVGNSEAIEQWIDKAFVTYYKGGNWNTGWWMTTPEVARLDRVVSILNQTQYIIASGYPPRSNQMRLDRIVMAIAFEKAFMEYAYNDLMSAYQGIGYDGQEAHNQVRLDIKFLKNGLGYQVTRKKSFEIAANEYRGTIIADHAEYQLASLTKQFKELEAIAETKNLDYALFLMTEFLTAIETEMRLWDPTTDSVRQSLLPNSTHLFSAYSKTIRFPRTEIPAYSFEHFEESPTRNLINKSRYTIVLPQLADKVALTIDRLLDRGAVYTNSKLGMLITAVDLFLSIEPGSSTSNLRRVKNRTRGGASNADDVRPRGDVETPRSVPCIGFGINNGVLVASRLDGIGNDFDRGVTDVESPLILAGKPCVPDSVLKAYDDYVSDWKPSVNNRLLPDAKETVLGFGLENGIFSKTSFPGQGGKAVYKSIVDYGRSLKKGRFYQIDTLHSSTPHIEVYNSLGEHIMTVDLSGMPVGGAKKGRSINIK